MIPLDQLYGVDTETHLISAGCVVPKLVCVSIGLPDDTGELYLAEEGLDYVERLLRDKSKHIAIHHAPFDLAVFAAERPHLLPLIFQAIDDGRVHCTKVRQMILDNAEGKLKFVWNEETGEFNKQSFHLHDLVRRHHGFDIKASKKGDDAWRLRYNELDGVPILDWPPEAREYAIDDAVWHRRVCVKQEEYIHPHGMPGGDAAEIGQMQAAWALYLLGAWGVRTDGEAVAKLRKEVERDLARQIEIAQRHKLIRKGKGVKGKAPTRDMKKIASEVENWYAAHNRPVKWTTGGKSGQPKIATDREQLTEITCLCGKDFKGCLCITCKCGKDYGDGCVCVTLETDGVHRGLWAVAEVVRLTKLLSTYIAALERGVKVPLCPSYNPIIETFRTSCSGGMKINGVPLGFNAQNPPRKHGVRECVVPRSLGGGRKALFAFSDYDTLEMLTLAQNCIDLFGYSHIADAARAGQDFHIAFAADMREVEYEEMLARVKAEDQEALDDRQFCKISNYGMSGGMAPKTFVDYAKGYGVIVPMSLAKQLHNNFRSKWAEMPEYFRYIESLMGDGGRAEVIVFPRSGLMRGDVSYTSAANGFFQHLAAMGAKDALYHVVKECYLPGTMPDGSDSPLYGCRAWLFAHDEIGIEIPYEGKRASDAALRLQAVMVARMQVWNPDVPIKATVCMTTRWYKGAKPVYVDGILVPSKPEGKTWVPDLCYQQAA